MSSSCPAPFATRCCGGVRFVSAKMRRGTRDRRPPPWRCAETGSCGRPACAVATAIRWSRFWRADKPADRHDVAARLAEIASDILSGALDRPAALPSGYDLWLDARLQDGRDGTSFKDQPLFAVTTFCQLLGVALRPAHLRDADRADGADHATGFDVASHGGTAIRAALDRVAASARGRLLDAPGKVFGPLYLCSPGLSAGTRICLVRPHPARLHPRSLADRARGDADRRSRRRATPAFRRHRRHGGWRGR